MNTRELQFHCHEMNLRHYETRHFVIIVTHESRHAICCVACCWVSRPRK